METTIVNLDHVTTREDLDLFLPPLEKEEVDNLYNDIKANGVRDPLVLWKTYDGEEQHILLDGHNRRRILKDLEINEAPAIYLDLKSLTEAKQWMLTNQLSRRNLDVFTRVQLALKFEDELKQEAQKRKQMGQFGADSLMSDEPPSEEKGTVLEILARKASTSKDTVHKIKRILDGVPQLRELVESKKISINQAAIIAKKSREEQEVVLQESIPEGHKNTPFGEGQAYDEDTGTWFRYKDCGGAVLGDSAAVIKDIQSECIDLVFSDPPYNADVAKWDKNFNPIWFLDECARVVKPGGTVLIFCSHHLLGHYLMHKPEGLEFQQILHWLKPNPAMRNKTKKHFREGKVRNYTLSIEYLLWWTKGDKYTFNADQLNHKLCGKNVRDTMVTTDVYDLKACGGAERIKDLTGETGKKTKIGKRGQIIYPTLHETQKPVELIKAILAVHSNPGDGVMEPFGGTGTTLEACSELGRNLLICEMNPVFMKTAQKRDKRKFQPPVLTEEEQEFIDRGGVIGIPTGEDALTDAEKQSLQASVDKKPEAKQKKIIKKAIERQKA